MWDNPRIAEVAARQLKDVGINMKLEFIDAGQYFANQRKGEFQTALHGMSSDFIDASLHQFYYSKGGGNSARLADPDLDRLIEMQRRELNKKERHDLINPRTGNVPLYRAADLRLDERAPQRQLP